MGDQAPSRLPLGHEDRIFSDHKALEKSPLGHKYRIFSYHKALKNVGKVGDHNARVQRWLEYLTGFDYTLEYGKGSANGNADSLSRLPQPTTEHDRSGSSRLTPVDDEAIYLVRACGLHTPFTPVRGIGLGGLMPQPDSAVLGGLHFNSTDFRVFRAHGPRMGIDVLLLSGDLSPVFPLASIPVMTVSAVHHFGLPPTPLSLRFSRCPSVLLRQNYPAPTPPSGASVALPPSGRMSTRASRRTTAATGAAQPTDDHSFGPGRVTRSSSSRVDPPPRVPGPRPPLAIAPGPPGVRTLSRRYPSRLTATERDL